MQYLLYVLRRTSASTRCRLLIRAQAKQGSVRGFLDHSVQQPNDAVVHIRVLYHLYDKDLADHLALSYVPPKPLLIVITYDFFDRLLFSGDFFFVLLKLLVLAHVVSRYCCKNYGIVYTIPY